MILDIITKALPSITNVIDDLHTSDEEKLAAKNKLAAITNAMQSDILKAQSSIITAEAQGKSWLQRNWRPISMLAFLVLVVCDSFGLLTFRLSDDAWDLLKIGLGGYVVGRSAEKIAPAVTNIIKKDR